MCKFHNQTAKTKLKNNFNFNFLTPNNYDVPLILKKALKINYSLL